MDVNKVIWVLMVLCGTTDANTYLRVQKLTKANVLLPNVSKTFKLCIAILNQQHFYSSIGVTSIN